MRYKKKRRKLKPTTGKCFVNKKGQYGCWMYKGGKKIKFVVLPRSY